MNDAAWWTEVLGELPAERTLPTDWMARGSCVHLDMPWTQDPGTLSWRTARQMRAVCDACPVLEDCAVFAELGEINGGWWAGGSYFRARKLGRRILGAAREAANQAGGGDAA